MTIQIEKNSASTVHIDTPETSWATFYYSKKGDLFLNSDWGNYFYSWRSFGEDFEKFLKGLEIGYLYSKMASSFSQFPVEGRRAEVLESLLLIFTKALQEDQVTECKNAMGEDFEHWANSFFETKQENGSKTSESFKYLDNYFCREAAFDDFVTTTRINKWSSNKFKKALKAYCLLKGHIFNPIDLCEANNRILQKINGRTREVLYIRTNNSSNYSLK